MVSITVAPKKPKPRGLKVSRPGENIPGGQAFVGTREKLASRAGISSKRAAEALVGADTGGGRQVTIGEVEQKREQLAGELGEAGAFEDVKQQPIIPPELVGTGGVISDVITSLFPKKGRNVRSAGQQRAEELEAQGPGITEPELTLLESQLTEEMKVNVAGIIEAEEGKELVAMGLPAIPALALGAGVGAIISNLFANPIGQAVGSDKTVKNLENGLLNINELLTITEGAVASGAMSADKAFQKLDGWEEIVFGLEHELKLQAINSPNARISLRGRAIETRLIKIKERILDQRTAIARIQIARGLETDNPEEINAFMQQLEQRFRQQ